MLDGLDSFPLEVDAYRNQSVPLTLEEDARQRALPRPCKRPAASGREVALVARALEAGVPRRVGDGAG